MSRSFPEMGGWGWGSGEGDSDVLSAGYSLPLLLIFSRKIPGWTFFLERSLVGRERSSVIGVGPRTRKRQGLVCEGGECRTPPQRRVLVPVHG